MQTHRGQTRRRPTRREHVERNTNADGAYLFCLIDVEWKLYEANLPRRLSTLWEARCLNRVAHLSEGLDASVEHTEFAVGPSVTQLANGVLISGQGQEAKNSE